MEGKEATTNVPVKRRVQKDAWMFVQMVSDLKALRNTTSASNDASKKQIKDTSPDQGKLKKDNFQQMSNWNSRSISHPEPNSQLPNNRNVKRNRKFDDEEIIPEGTMHDKLRGPLEYSENEFESDKRCTRSRLSDQKDHKSNFNKHCRNTMHKKSGGSEWYECQFNSIERCKNFQDSFDQRDVGYGDNKFKGSATCDKFAAFRTRHQYSRDQFDFNDKNIKISKETFDQEQDFSNHVINKFDRDATHRHSSGRFNTRQNSAGREFSSNYFKQRDSFGSKNKKNIDTFDVNKEIHYSKNQCEFSQNSPTCQISDISDKELKVNFQTTSVSKLPELTQCLERDVNESSSPNLHETNIQNLDWNIEECDQTNQTSGSKIKTTETVCAFNKSPELTQCLEWNMDESSTTNSNETNIQNLDWNIEEFGQTNRLYDDYGNCIDNNSDVGTTHDKTESISRNFKSFGNSFDEGNCGNHSNSKFDKNTMHNSEKYDTKFYPKYEQNSITKISFVERKSDSNLKNLNSFVGNDSVHDSKNICKFSQIIHTRQISDDINFKVSFQTSDNIPKLPELTNCLEWNEDKSSMLDLNRSNSKSFDQDIEESVLPNSVISSELHLKTAEKSKGSETSVEIQKLEWNFDETEETLNSKFEATDSWSDVSQSSETIQTCKPDIKSQKLSDSLNDVSRSPKTFQTKLNTKQNIEPSSYVSKSSETIDNVKSKRKPSKMKTPNRVRSEISSRTNDRSVVDTTLPVETEIIIPPPISCEEESIITKNWSSSEASLDLNKKSNNTSVSSSEDGSNICFLIEPDSKQLEGITDFINKTVREKSVSNTLADRVVKDMNRLFSTFLEGNTIDRYGSYYSDIAIETSDMNLVMKSDSTVKRGFMLEVYKVLSKEQHKYIVHPFEEGNSAYNTKVCFLEPDMGISCQLACLGKKELHYKEMAELLRVVCLHDERVKTLIIAVKIWAEICLINDVEEGQLHPIGFIMMVLHFLQHYKKPILPIPIKFYKNCKIESPPARTDSTVGELWLAFLRYYFHTFNWAQDVVTISSEEPVSKESKGWRNVWMAIEDPFTYKNIAQSVTNCNTAESIKACLRATYEYFCSNPREGSPLDFAKEESESTEDFPSHRSRYSFQECMVDTNSNFCNMCDELDDICESCKGNICSPPMASVPPMTEDFLEEIRKGLYFVYDKYILMETHIKERKKFVENLERQFNEVFPDIELHLYGSSTNGFGFHNSDLDICATFKFNKERRTANVLKSLRSCLRRQGDFENVVAIFDASIPILKFHYKPKKWRGDICINNTLAIDNSKLLHTYSLIDERCKILGCALKLLAKKALIAEVTDKALSSYSYLIMVIHFLQQTEPPILPVLQDIELQKTNFKLDCIVEGYNVWFFTSIKDLKLIANDTSVEQLWLDLLDFYCSYDSNRIVTIRQKEPLFLVEKLTSARSFNIQDPFIETKNLGRVVSAKKAQEMENIFKRARYLFRTPKEFPSSVKDLEDYFFSTMSLTGRIHKEAHCDLCGKFGHEKKDCTHSAPMRKFQMRYSNRHIYRKPPTTWKTTKYITNINS